jgi:protein-serine/threonine kinase
MDNNLNTPIGDYNLIKELGKGQFGQVYLASKMNSQNNKKYAIKQISKSKINTNPLLLRLFQTEVSVMQKISHPNIIKLHDFIE